MVETMTVDGSAANSSACTAGGGKGAGVRDAGVRDAGVRDAGCLRGGLSVDSVVAGLDVAALKAEIAALSRVDALVVARRSAVVAELARRDGDVAEQLRKSGNMSGRQARKAAKTAGGLARLPKTREALERGEIGAGQAEALASRMDKPEQARNVRDNEDALLEKAKCQDVDEFARTMRQEDIDGSPDGGNTHAQRQRQSRKASMWIDDDTGMHHLFAQFDPVTGARISTQLAAMTDQLWQAEHLPGRSRHNKRAVAQRRADALEALICQTLAATKNRTTKNGSASNGKNGSASNGKDGSASNGKNGSTGSSHSTGGTHGTTTNCTGASDSATSTTASPPEPPDAPGDTSAGQPNLNSGSTDGPTPTPRRGSAASACQAEACASAASGTRQHPTPQPCVSSTPASTSPQSPSGSDTKASKQPGSTSTPT